MTKKRKKRRRRSRPGPGPVPATVDVEEVEEQPADGTVDEPPEEDGRPARSPWARGAPSPYPPFGASLAQGLRAAGSRPLILATAFLSLLATWGLAAAIGVPLQPRVLGAAMSVPPMHLFITDLPVALSAGTSSLAGLLVLGGVFLLRAITFGLLIALLGQELGDGRTDLRAALGMMPRVAIRLMALLFLEAAALLFANQLVASFLADLSILLLGAALYFLVYAPIVTVVEDAPPREAFRRGFRAARLPGTRHVSMVLGYFFLAVYAVLISPFGALAPATPSVVVWAYALAATFLHVAVLGAFVYRWLEVRDQVPSGPAPRPGRPS